MISAETIAGLEQRKVDYILGARERSDALVRKIVLVNDGPFVPLLIERQRGETQLFVKPNFEEPCPLYRWCRPGSSRPGKRGGDKRTVIMCEVVNGLMYILSTGCQWRAIPKDLPPRSTLYDYFDLWSWDGTLDLIHHELYVKCREAVLKEASPTAAVIDSQSVKSAEKGGPRLIRRVTTRERRSRARSGIFSSTRKAC